MLTGLKNNMNELNYRFWGFADVINNNYEQGWHSNKAVVVSQVRTQVGNYGIIVSLDTHKILVTTHHNLS